MSPLEITREGKEEEQDRSLWKTLIFAVLAGTFLFFGINSWNKFLASIDSFDALWSFAFFSLFFVLFVLQTFFVKSRVRIALLSALQALVAVLPFYSQIFGPETPIYLLAGGAVLMLSFLFASFRGQSALSNSLEVKFFQVSRRILTRAVGGLLVFLAAVFYTNYFIWGNFNKDLGRKIVDEALVAAKPIVKTFMAVDFTPEGTIGDFLRAIAEKELRRLQPSNEDVSGGVDFQRLPKEEQDKAIRAAIPLLSDQLQKIFGVFNNDDKIQEVVFRFVQKYLAGLTPAARSFLNVGAALLLFFILKGFFFFIYWLIEIVAFLTFKFLLISGFAYITLESRGREFIMLS
ncbi:MAG TPA: hypothetical protein VNK70_02750 [Candidatus Paceibacterota bacterium]|nr:hypothetical protein [Candidatus Paceibacterota bacterium]